MTSIMEQASCSICLHPFDQINQKSCDLNCQHSYHVSCIQAWFKKSRESNRRPRCPNCRTPISANEIFTEDALQSNVRLANFSLSAISAEQQQSNRCCSKAGLFVLLVFAALIWAGMSFYYFYECGDIYLESKKFPIFSFGVNAKGFIAIGVFAQGVVAIGVISLGLISVSLLGIGLVAFVGQLGGGIGVGIYQIGVSFYCVIAQISIAIWQTRKAQLGYSLIAPMCYPEKKSCVTC